MFSRRTALRLLAFGIATTLSWSLWAACADAVMPQSAQMACCKDGQLCAPGGSGSDCCNTESGRARTAVLSVVVKPLHQLTAIAVSWDVPTEIIAAGLTRIHSAAVASPPKLDVGPPPYIAFSSLLI